MLDRPLSPGSSPPHPPRIHENRPGLRQWMVGSVQFRHKLQSFFGHIEMESVLTQVFGLVSGSGPGRRVVQLLRPVVPRVGPV